MIFWKINSCMISPPPWNGLKIKILIMEFKKLELLYQHKLHMKPTTSLYSVIQRCPKQQIYVFYVFYCNLKEKDHIWWKIISKNKEMFICKISNTIILIGRKLVLVGPVQQKIKLLSPNLGIFWLVDFKWKSFYCLLQKVFLTLMP